MKLFSTFLGAAVTVVALSSTALAQEVTLRLHQLLPIQAAIPSKGLVPWAERIEAASDGRIKIEHYPSMQLGGAPPSLFGQAQDGVVDIIWTVLGYTPGRFPKSEVFETPFLMTNAEHTSVAFQKYVEKYAADEFADVHLLAVHTHGHGLFHTKEPINSLEDLQGMKIRGGSRIINEMLVSLGAEPIGMPVPAVSEALSTGVIEGTTIPWEVTTALKTSELVHNHTSFSGVNGLYTQTFGVVMNKASYENLPDDLKAILDAESGVKLAAALGRVMDDADVVGLKVATDLGNNIVNLDEAETAKWNAAAAPIIDNWIAATPDGQMLYDAAKALIAEESKM